MENYKKLSFINDVEKMHDFFIQTKNEFLESYSYLTEKEYAATLQEVNYRKATNLENDHICASCGYKFYGDIYSDWLGLHAVCPSCGASFDI